jgi:hypothetical protein
VPAKLSAIRRSLEALGYTLTPPRGGGSHWKAKGKGGSYPIPAHNGLREVVPDHYIHSLCRHFNIDVEAFKRSL